MNRETADNEIRARLATNDPSALEIIWAHYASDLLGYLMSIFCSRQDAEDVLQDIFVTIAEKRSTIAKARKIKPYLFRLSRNVALNRIKRDKRRREKDHQVSGWLVLDGEGENQNERTTTYQLESALAALPEKQRSVVVLKFYRNKTFREIGEMLGISENTAGSRYRYGMAKLRHLLPETL